MVTPKKRRNSRSERRAGQRYTAPGPTSGTIPRPPDSCPPWHFYWCDGHTAWHHHDEFVVTAIERTLQQQQQQSPGDQPG